MDSRKEGIILGRLLQELKDVRSIGLGTGYPSTLRKSFPEEILILDLSAAEEKEEVGRVDLAIVEPLEVSSQGDLVAAPGTRIDSVESLRWIAASPIERDGEPRLVKECRLPVQRASCVDLIITEYGVIRIGPVGFVLSELAPGASSDDVRLRMNAGLHVADDLQLMR